MFTAYRITLVLVTIVALLFAAVGGAQAAPRHQDGGSPEADLAAPHAPDRIVVKFKEGPGVQATDVTAGQGAQVIKELPQIGAQVLRVPTGALASQLAAYRADPRVAYAELDYLARPAYKPNDPKYSDETQWGPQKVQAPLAWDLSTGDANVVVAVVDFGVDLQHPDLQMWMNSDEVAGNGIDDDGNGYTDDVYGYDFANYDSDPQDDYGHGTHVAGIAAAVTDNATGIAGVAFDSQVMAVKVGDGNTGTARYSAIADGIIYAADNGADVINLSVGGYAYSGYLGGAVAYAWDAGCVVVAAAGNNDKSDPFYPAAYEDAIGVSATDQNDVRKSWSNYGSYVSVAAPGASIYSTYWNGGSTYTTMSGTSMAAPHVAGLAALLFAQDGNRSNADVRGLMEESADDLGDSGWDAYYGHGRINAYTALGTTAAMVDPDVGGTLESADGDLTLDFPGSAVSEVITVVHTPQISPSSDPPIDLVFANMAYTLEATDESGNPMEQFAQPYTLSLRYEDSDWQEAGVDSEEDLNLYYWNAEQEAWEGVLPCNGCSRDTVDNELVVVLDHFSEFGLMGDKGGTTSVTLSSFNVQNDGSEVVTSLFMGALGLLGLVGLLIAVVAIKIKSPDRGVKR